MALQNMANTCAKALPLVLVRYFRDDKDQAARVDELIRRVELLYQWGLPKKKKIVCPQTFVETTPPNVFELIMTFGQLAIIFDWIN